MYSIHVFVTFAFVNASLTCNFSVLVYFRALRVFVWYCALSISSAPFKKKKERRKLAHTSTKNTERASNTQSRGKHLDDSTAQHTIKNQFVLVLCILAYYARVFGSLFCRKLSCCGDMKHVHRLFSICFHMSSRRYSFELYF